MKKLLNPISIRFMPFIENIRRITIYELHCSIILFCMKISGDGYKIIRVNLIKKGRSFLFGFSLFLFNIVLYYPSSFQDPSFQDPSFQDPSYLYASLHAPPLTSAYLTGLDHFLDLL